MRRALLHAMHQALRLFFDVSRRKVLILSHNQACMRHPMPSSEAGHKAPKAANLLAWNHVLERRVRWWNCEAQNGLIMHRCQLAVSASPRSMGPAGEASSLRRRTVPAWSSMMLTERPHLRAAATGP